MPSTKYTYNKSIRLTHLQLAWLDQPRLKGKAGHIIRFLLDKLIDGKLPPEVLTELEKIIASVPNITTGTPR
jgi:hypothetical protein